MILPVQNYEELIYQFDPATNGIDGWESSTNSSIFVTQDGLTLYGGDSPQISRIFLDLNPHYQVKVKMEFWLTQQKSPGQIIMQLDEIQVYTQSYDGLTMSKLKGPTPNGFYFDTIISQYPGKKRTSSIQIEVQGQTQCGIRTLQYYIERCPSGCDACDNFDYLACKKWRIFSLNFNQYLFSSLQGWATQFPWSTQQFNLCANCHFLQQNGIQYFGVLPPHKGIMLRFYRQFTIGVWNIQINGLKNIVQQPTGFFQGELIINDHIATNLFIEFGQGYIRDIELYYQLDDIYLNLEIRNCYSVINNDCVSCLDGWEFEEIQNECHPLCGNQMIQGLEECDDGNDIQNDGCYECKFKCDVNCTYCEFGKQYKCKECKAGYLQLNGYCYPHCGDGIQILGIEECDDGNSIPFDGCFNCTFQCQQNCIICFEGVCNQYCEEGFILMDSSCIPICGDGIITNLEECEDDNNIPYDGCYLCEFSCPLNCLECQNGYCLQCNTNYQLSSNNQCNIIEYKEFDDYNNDPQDGGHQFWVELDQVCRRLNQDTNSECSYFTQPKLLIQYKKMLWNKQYVTLTFSQPVKVGSNRMLFEEFTYSILNLPKSQYIIKTQSSQEISNSVKIIEHQLEIEIFKLLEFKPVLNINFPQEIINQYGFSFSKTYNTTLQIPTYLDEKQTYYSEIIQRVNRYALYSYGGVSSLMIIQGRYEILIEIINLLQFQNYLKYINVKFPQNLLLYFESYDLLSIEAMYQLLNIEQLEGVLLYKEFKESSGKFQFYKQNADLLSNLEWQIIQSSFYILLILLSIGTKKFILSNYFRTRIYTHLSQWKSNSGKEISIKFVLWFYKKCQQLIGVVDIFSKNGLKTILLANGWDLIFKGMLYLKYLLDNEFREIFSIVLALVLISFYIIFILNSNDLYPQNNLINYKNLKEKRLEVFKLGISFCFIVFLIFLESSEILQLGLISLINLMQLKLIYNYRKIIRSYVIQMAIQSSVLIFTLSSFIYIEEASKFINEDFKIKCGWLHMFLLSFGVLIEITSMIIEQIQYYFGMCNKKKHNNIQQDQFIIMNLII
ncbi:unnamed protein product [Paramecium octaurelia]|uniref:Uncharacterized protein n=1 Tax=Paramecium octaurelia TaxID=43137 RepID=A0A8S1UU11_PAROT|nr:unnamed protein product [Paramecium octaurelia]